MGRIEFLHKRKEVEDGRSASGIASAESSD